MLFVRSFLTEKFLLISAFIKPTSAENAAIVDTKVSQLCDVNDTLFRDSQRYTKEKMDQLSALLGSSLIHSESSFISMFSNSSGKLYGMYSDDSSGSQASSILSANSIAPLLPNLHKPDLLPENSADDTFIKPARGFSYIRVPVVSNSTGMMFIKTNDEECI